MPSRLTLTILFLAFSTVAMAQTPGSAAGREPTAPHALEGPIEVYQRVISGADGDRCPMHPSCSTYAQEAFRKHGLVMGWIMACDRLLRCGRDEANLSGVVRINGQRLIHDPLQHNDFWWK